MNSKNHQNIFNLIFWSHSSHSIEFSSMSFTQSLFQKKNCKRQKHFIWKKMVKIWWNSCSKYFFSTIWSFILFNQSITYLVLGVNKLKGNKSKQQIFDMNSKNDTCIMYWPKISTSFHHFLENKVIPMFSFDQKFIKLFSILFLNYFNFKSKKKNKNRKHFVYKKMIKNSLWKS